MEGVDEELWFSLLATGDVLIPIRRPSLSLSRGPRNAQAGRFGLGISSSLISATVELSAPNVFSAEDTA